MKILGLLYHIPHSMGYTASGVSPKFTLVGHKFQINSNHYMKLVVFQREKYKRLYA